MPFSTYDDLLQVEPQGEEDHKQASPLIEKKRKGKRILRENVGSYSQDR